MNPGEERSAATCPECGADAGDNWFDRSICPEPCGSMHTRCSNCGSAYGDCPFEEPTRANENRKISGNTPAAAYRHAG